ncbi:MAG: hypothetical protein ACK4YP_19620, partial [Myxococcota bacterium]
MQPHSEQLPNGNRAPTGPLSARLSSIGRFFAPFLSVALPLLYVHGLHAVHVLDVVHSQVMMCVLFLPVLVWEQGCTDHFGDAALWRSRRGGGGGARGEGGGRVGWATVFVFLG